MTRGFSLIEVVVTLTIVGILTGIMIPSYNNYNKASIDLEVKEKTLVIQSEMMTFINQQLYNANQKYPIFGASSNDFVGVNNILNDSLITFVRGLMTYSQVLDISTFTKIVVGEFSGFDTGIGYIDVTINYKSGENVICEFQIKDNQITFKDVAIIHSITYNNGKGQSYKALM